MRWIHAKVVITVLAARIVVPTLARAQSGPSAPAISASIRQAVTDTLAARLLRLYVDADTARLIARRVQSRARDGAYDAITDPRRFSDALTTDLQSVNGDRHLTVSYSPPIDAGPRRPAGAPLRGDAARRDHWGLARVDVLAGNVGYMKVTGFEGSPAAIDATSAALKYLEGTDAMIFDFRGMGGGSGEQSNFLISHFVSADTVASLVVSNRSNGTKRTRYTLARVPGTRRANVPVWILTDRGTASAGEDFSFVLQQLGRARVVGDRTAGAGHNNTFADLGNGFGASISITRVSDAKTGKEWERVGVQPDIRTTPRHALAVAHAAALDSLLRLESDVGVRVALAAAHEGVLAQVNPHLASAPTLAAYAGTYEGGRVIALDDGALVYRRDAARPPRALVAVNDTTFILNGNLRVTFGRAANGQLQMVQHLADGSVFVTPRTGDVPSEVAP